MFEAQFRRRKSWSDGLAHRLVITERSTKYANRTQLTSERRSANRACPTAFRFHHFRLLGLQVL